MPNLGKFQMTEATNWTGLTTRNHLGKLFGQSPQVLSKTVIRLLASSGMNNLDTILSALPIKKMDTEDDFTWKLVGNDDKNVPLLYAYQTAGTPITSGDNNVGANGTLVYLVFPEKRFSDVNVLVGEKNEIYQFRVISEPVRSAEGWIYETQLMGANTAGVPGEELVANKRFSKDFSPVEDTMSVKGGELTFSSPIDMRQSFTTLRMEHKEPGNNLNRRVSANIVGVDANGNKQEFSVWTQYVEWQFERQWSQEKARACMYSRSNRSADGTYHDIGKSGYYIKQGAGIREQMEVSNTVFYNEFSLDLLESILSDMVEGKLDLSDRSFMIRTGTRGASKFNKAVTAEASGWVSLRGGNHPSLIKQTSSSMHSNSLKAGFQFTEWEAPNGIKVKLEVDALYDDKVRNKILHPQGGVAESYRYDILYMGPEEEPNIQKVETAQGELRGYLSGMRNPFTGQLNNEYMGTMEDSATYTRYCNLAVTVLDPSRTATLLPSILA